MRALRNAIERKVIEEALFQMKERAQVTLDCISDAVICTDLAGNISFLNPAAESLTGWGHHEAVGRPLAETLCIMGHDAVNHSQPHGKGGRAGPRRLPACKLHPCPARPA
jgi:PAS domain-containing protein